MSIETSYEVRLYVVPGSALKRLSNSKNSPILGIHEHGGGFCALGQVLPQLAGCSVGTRSLDWPSLAMDGPCMVVVGKHFTLLLIVV